ncbi:MAG: HAD family phosphatase [bacterium]|nr:HAD family phosphatase [bacterium]
MKFSTVIFDLDGTILDNEEVYAKVISEVLQKYGVARDKFDETHPHITGVGLEENWTKLKEKFDLSSTVSVLKHETQTSYLAKLNEVEVNSGFVELVEALREEGVAIGLATSNEWFVVEDVLEDLDLQKYFDVIVTVEEVLHPKPAPDLFLEAARKLGAEYSECVVIEDSVVGIKAAKEADMVGVAIASNFTLEEEFEGASWVVSSMEEINPKLLDALFQN